MRCARWPGEARFAAIALIVGLLVSLVVAADDQQQPAQPDPAAQPAAAATADAAAAVEDSPAATQGAGEQANAGEPPASTSEAPADAVPSDQDSADQPAATPPDASASAVSDAAQPEPSAPATAAADSAPAPASAPASAAPAGDLPGQAWTLAMRSMFGEAAVFQDTVKFDGGQFVSAKLAADGYAPAAYTRADAKDGGIAWEAVQLKPQRGVAIWQGELMGQAMRGTLSIQPVEGASEDYEFVNELGDRPASWASSAPGAVEPPPVPREPVEVAEQRAEPVETPAAQAQPAEKPKQRRGWFRRGD